MHFRVNIQKNYKLKNLHVVFYYIKFRNLQGWAVLLDFGAPFLLMGLV